MSVTSFDDEDLEATLMLALVSRSHERSPTLARTLSSVNLSHNPSSSSIPYPPSLPLSPSLPLFLPPPRPPLSIGQTSDETQFGKVKPLDSSVAAVLASLPVMAAGEECEYYSF